jgi:hypothetical protein
MRLTSVAITFIFFGTVLATPIYSLRDNAVELSKRAGTETAMPGLTGGDGGGSDGEGERPTSPPPNRGRRRSRGRGGSINKGKARADVAAADDQGSDGEIKTTETGGRKRSKSGQGRTTSKRPKSGLVTQAQFVEALERIEKGKTVGTAGSRSLGVYHINGDVLGEPAVVKLIDERITQKEIRNEVARDRTVDQLLGWGWKAGNPKIAYILLKNLGTHVSKVPGLDLTSEEDKQFVKDKKAAALQHHETEYGLKHTDPEGDGNFLWKHNPAGATKDEQYHVTPIDWEGAENVGGGRLTTPKALVVPANIYAPAESQKSSDKASDSAGKTPSEGSPKGSPKQKHTGVTGTRQGSRSQTRAGTSGGATR